MFTLIHFCYLIIMIIMTITGLIFHTAVRDATERLGVGLHQNNYRDSNLEGGELGSYSVEFVNHIAHYTSYPPVEFGRRQPPPNRNLYFYLFLD